MPRETCKSVTFSPKNNVCQLNGKSKNDVKIVKNRASDFYHRLCFDKRNGAIRRDVVESPTNCFTSTTGKVLIGIVDHLLKDVSSLDDCQSHCSSSITKYDTICKSAMYYEKEKECIIASQSKADIPDLFIDDEKSVYIENNCLNKEDKDMMVKPSEVFKGSSKFSTDPKSEKVEKADSSTNVEKTTLSTLLKNKSGASSGPKLEFSGYDGASDTVSNTNIEDSLSTKATTTTSTTTQAPLNPKIIDNYNVNVVNTPKSGYGRRLRDTRVKSCFREVRPVGKLEALRVVKAYTLEQCTDMCRICTKCLVKQKKCKSVAFDVSRELCALAAKSIVDGGSFKDDIIYHNRISC